MVRQRSVAEVVILMLVTCGIYWFFWVYMFSNDVKNHLNDDTINPSMELVLTIITCGIYSIYWVYRYGKLISKAQEQAGKSAEDNAVLYLVLQVLQLGIVNAALMQSSFNNVID
jgi:heme/copper-type cytochrome/quinol oxidase subunit 2